MSDDKKYGIGIIISAFLLILLALMLSDGWIPQATFFQNLMYALEIQLISIEKTIPGGGPWGLDKVEHSYYLVDVYTKYVVLVLLTLASYGLTTFLGITPAFRPWKAKGDTQT